MEKCGKKFQSRRNLSQHVNREHQPELKASSTQTVNMSSDQSELDLIALLSCVATDEDLKLADNCKQTAENDGELITVDASAITPVKNEHSKDSCTPNIISKSRRKRKQQRTGILKSTKKIHVDQDGDDASTINMQDLV